MNRNFDSVRLRRRYLVLTVVTVLAALGVWQLTESDPRSGVRHRVAGQWVYDISSDELRASLDRTGLKIKYKDRHAGSGFELVAGIARDAKDKEPIIVEFEFAVHDPGTQVTAQNLQMFGFRRTKVRLPGVHMRGVLGNVAYATYIHSKSIKGSAARTDHVGDSYGVVSYKTPPLLDDALFAAFPDYDARVFPLLKRPPGWD